jgi:thiamine-phosphate pyrophosphorylase
MALHDTRLAAPFLFMIIGGRSVNLELYVIIDEHYLHGKDLLDITAKVIRGGATTVQLRSKNATGLDMYELALNVRRLTAEAGVSFIVNDRVDIAMAVDADGVHLGQDDMPAAVARRILGPGKIIGVSAATPEEAAQAEKDGATYLGVGAIYATGTKNDAGAPIGPEAIKAVTRACSLPAVGIGGINAANAAPVVDAGASGVAVISAIVGHADPEAAASEVLQVVRTAKQRRDSA